MRYLRCKCGEHEMWTTDGVQDCQGCEKCRTTFSEHPDFHKPIQPHKWGISYNNKTGKPFKICDKCHQIDEKTFKLSNIGESYQSVDDVDKFYESITIENTSIRDTNVEPEINEDIPKTIDETIIYLTNDDNKKFASDKTEKEYLSELHHGFGTGLRNHLGLWNNSELAKWFNERGIYHADDMSSIILVSVYRTFKGEEINLDEQIQHYREYWEKVDPKVNKGLI